MGGRIQNRKVVRNGREEIFYQQEIGICCVASVFPDSDGYKYFLHRAFAKCAASGDRIPRGNLCAGEQWIWCSIWNHGCGRISRFPAYFSLSYNHNRKKNLKGYHGIFEKSRQADTFRCINSFVYGYLFPCGKSHYLS